MKTRCKMFVSAISRSYQHDTGMQVTLDAVQDGSEENEKFFNATPCGRLDINVKNDSLKEISIGDEFYVDLTKIEKAEN